MRIRIGEVTHYYRKIGVAAVVMDDGPDVTTWLRQIRKGNRITIKGNKTFFDQKVESIELNHVQYNGISWISNMRAVNVWTEETKHEYLEQDECKFGLMVKERVREGDVVYKYVDDEDIQDLIIELSYIQNTDTLSENEVKLLKLDLAIKEVPFSILNQSVSLGPWLKRLYRIVRQ